MKKKVFGRKFKRDKNERKALFKSLLSALVLEERIKTTEEKAKSIKGRAEKLVTYANKKGAQAASGMYEYLTIQAAEKMISQIAPRFTKGNGGYTRIVRIGNRFNDNASLVLLEWTEKETQNEGKNKKEEKKGSTETKEPEETKGTRETKGTKKIPKRKSRSSK